jgi:hypothetical protein
MRVTNKVRGCERPNGTELVPDEITPSGTGELWSSRPRVS